MEYGLPRKLSNAVREGKTALINNQIQTGKSKGMFSMDQSLGELVRSGTVLPEEALDRALDRESFKGLIASLPEPRQPGPARPAHARPTAVK